MTNFLTSFYLLYQTNAHVRKKLENMKSSLVNSNVLLCEKLSTVDFPGNVRNSLEYKTG